VIASDNKFKVTLPSDRELEMTRMLDAPRELVFKTMLDPDLVARWWGPRRYTTIVDKMDVRVGGKWRFANRAADGTEFWFNGEYKEIVPPERVVQTFEFEPMAGHVSVDAAHLEDLGDGRTLLRVRSTFQSKEDRDGMLSSGMESGANETYDRLAEILAEKLQASAAKR
jgi:uncharacterized protein YndB with AHSA1/START domain